MKNVFAYSATCLYCSLKAFIGQRYGARPLKETIQENEFNKILEYAGDLKETIEKCYCLDQNDLENRKQELKSKADIFSSLNVFTVLRI